MFHIIFKILLIFLIFLDILIFIGLLYISSVRHKPASFFPDTETPTLIVLPCRGIDYDMEKNLASLKDQDHRNFEILAVVDSHEDSAVDLLKRFNIRYIISEKGPGSGKVSAISTAIRKDSGMHRYTVIADSDILVPPNWLSSLISPLSLSENGLSTTFPFFRPVGGFWSKVKMVWGFVGLGMMESTITRFGWGGSLAFRTELLAAEDLKYFSAHVSDDIALTKICKKKGLKIAYVPEAHPDVLSPDSYRVFLEWSNRQTALSISSSKNVIRYGLLFYGSTIFLFLTSFVITLEINTLFAFLFLPAVLNSLRSSYRAHDHRISGFFIQFLIPFIYFSNLVKGGRMKTISWRGNNYDLMKEFEP